MKDLKFDVDRANVKQDTAIYKALKFTRDVYFLVNFGAFEWLYLVHYRPDKPTKLENVVNFNLLFLTIWVSCRLSHKKPTRTQNLSNDDHVGGH